MKPLRALPVIELSPAVPESRGGVGLVAAFLALAFAAVAVVVTQVLFGGYGFPIFSFPGYASIAVAGVLGGVALILRPRWAVRASCLLSAGCLCAYIAWRGVNAANAYPAFVWGLLFFACVLVYLLMASLTDPRARSLFWFLFFGVVFAQCFVAMIQAIRDPSFAPVAFLSPRYAEWTQRTFTFRTCGFQVNPNAFAWSLNAAALMSLSMAWWGRWSYAVKILLFYLAAMSIVGTVLTASRGGMLALSAGMTVFLALSIPALFTVARRRGAAYFLIGVAVLLSAGVAAGFVYSQNFAIQDRLAKIVSDSWRVEISGMAFRTFLDHPWFGVGPGGFLYAVRGFHRGNRAEYAHNDWAQLLCDYGWVGFSIVILALLLHVGNGLRERQRTVREKLRGTSTGRSNAFALLVGSISFVAAAAVHSFVDFNTQISGNAFLLAACLGVMASRERDKQPTLAVGVSVRLVGLCLLAASIAFGYGLWKLAPGQWALLRMDNALYGQGDPKEVEGAAARVVTATVPDARLLFLLSRSEQQHALLLADATAFANEQRRVLERLNAAHRFEPDDGVYRADRSRVSIQLSDDAAAFRDAFAAIEAEPFQPYGYEAYGAWLEAQGQLTEAVRMYRIAAACGPAPLAKSRLKALPGKP